MLKSKKVDELIRAGNLKKLKSFLDKHEFNINKRLDMKGRTALHIAVYKKQSSIVVFLLSIGADPMVKDMYGNVVLLKAMKMAVTDKKVYKKIALPLCRACPMALLVPNSKGQVCKKYLEQIRKGKKRSKSEPMIKLSHSKSSDRMDWSDSPNVESNETSSCNVQHQNSDDEWEQRLRDELDDENAMNEGHYEEDYYQNPGSYESFDAWSDRMYREYLESRRCNSPYSSAHRRERNPTPPPPEPIPGIFNSNAFAGLRDASQSMQLEGNLIRRKLYYERQCDKCFINNDTRQLKPSDIPDCDNFITILLCNLTEETEQKRYLKKQQYLWHPDKFIQRCGHCIKDDQKESILDKVNKLSQLINKSLQDHLRT